MRVQQFQHQLVAMPDVIRLALRAAITTFCCTLISCQTQPSTLLNTPVSALDATLVRDSGPVEARLDSALDKHSYDEIVRQTDTIMAGQDGAMRVRILNWERLKDLNGLTDSTFIMQIYAADLYAEATHLPEPDKSSWMKLAVTSYLRTAGTILSEGVQCQNSTAADSRLSVVSQALLPIRRVLQTYSEDQRIAIARDVDLLMQFSFPGRYPDNWLCQGAFRPYSTWSEPRVVALKVFRKSLGLPEMTTSPLPKSSAVIPFFG